MKFLNQGNDTKQKDIDVGRIDEEEIRRLDAFHKRRREFDIERRGTAWSGIGPPPTGSNHPTPNPNSSSSSSSSGAAGFGAGTGSGAPIGITPLITQSTGESVPTLAMEPDTESDHSSVVSTSDKVLPSESEAEGDVLDMQKYRLPDITKTKSLSQPVTAVETPPPPTPPPKDTPPMEASPKLAPAVLAQDPTPQPPASAALTPTQSPPDSIPVSPKASDEEEVSVLDSNNDIDIGAYFQKRHFSRANSIYTLSKASFTNQIQQLTSMKLPPTTIASEITSLPSSTLAGRALHRAANDIKLWMAKAAEVLSGLDADDDVEWAAAAGREGLAEVDAAVSKFEGLVTVYISAIEDLQARPDITLLPTKDQTTLISQMEEIVSSWAKIKQTLKGIKNQVEIAMEWEELWNNVLGDIGAEIENLSRLVFEMEERRHRVISDSVAESAEKFDIAELETIVEETPRQAKMHNNRFSMPPTLSVLSPISPIPQIEQENSRLLALFAKLQPLRASLDFLPMRLASFEVRGSKIFPSACDELTRRKEQLEEQEKKLEADADALREELGEDKWVHSFRQAGSKAVAMYESCMKSIQRLTQAIEEIDDEKIASRIATYKDKRDHYPPSMKRVLELIDIEMKHRSTVNGEILRIQQDVRQKYTDLESVIKDMDAILEEFTASRKLRDSVSTVVSARTEASLTNSAVDTPNSSPASSVIMSRKGSDQGVSPAFKRSRQLSGSASKPPVPTNRRYSSVPMGTPSKFYISQLPLGRDSIPPPPRATSTMSTRSVTPKSERPAVKPRWNSSTNMRDTVVGHNFKPLTLTTPSPFRRESKTPQSVRSTSSQSSIPVRSPLGRTATCSPSPSTRPASTTPAQQSTRRSLASPKQSPATPVKGKLSVRSPPGSSTPASTQRMAIAADDGDATVNDESPMARRNTRPPSAANSRRSTNSATSKPAKTLTTNAAPSRTASRIASIDEGRNSRAGGRTSRVSGRQSSLGDRPSWK